MEQTYIIKPDTKTIKEVIARGGDSLKKCFQCGTCSVVCSLSPAERPFPRKEMIWAQWGLRDRLVNDPDVWLCHQCNDCTTSCPRGAKPGDVLAAIRSIAIGQFSRPGFLVKAVASPKYLLPVLAVPAFLLFLFLWATGNLAFPEGEIVFSHFIPVEDAYIGMAAITVFLLLVLGAGALRFWKSMSQSETVPGSGGGLKGLISLLFEILRHNKFGKCGDNKFSRYTHLALLYGAILTLLAAGLGAVYHLAGVESPYALLSPVKIAGNLGALLLMAACIVVILRRFSAGSNIGSSSYFDWFLIWMLFFVTVSGIATEVVRLAGLAPASYWVYLIHLWLMFALLLYGPYTKGAHLLYRTLAITYANKTGRTVD